MTHEDRTKKLVKHYNYIFNFSRDANRAYREFNKKFEEISNDSQY